MRLELIRYSSQADDTLGLLFAMEGERRTFLCYTLEDEHRTRKVYGETRIPAGDYRLQLRKEGGHHERYKAKYQFHRGMLELQDVPNFKYILIHTGNKDDHTAGCILVGDTAQQNVTEEGFIGHSVSAYSRIYPAIAQKILDNHKVVLRIVDLDTPINQGE